MGFYDFDQDQILDVLQRERVIRVAFSAGSEHFVVPLFYVLHEGALYGLTTSGRKTRMAAANPQIAFQVDTSASTGAFEWQSVVGQGTWEVVDDEATVGAFVPKLQAKLTDSPPWAQQLLQQRLATLGRVAWRISPTAMTGRAHAPDQ